MTNGTLDMQIDGPRLKTQMARVRSKMLTGKWWTLAALQEACGGSESAISARIRDLRKEGYTVERKRQNDNSGLYQYRVVRHG